MTEHTPAVCSRCGAQTDAPALHWSWAAEPRSGGWLCGACTREHVRSLEARLDEEHW